MELVESFRFSTILTESIKLLPKNGKLMALIAIVSIILSWSFSFLFALATASLAEDMLADFMPDPSSFGKHDPAFDPYSFSTHDNASFTPNTGFNPFLNPRVKKDMAVMITIQIAFYLAVATVFFFSTISTIMVSVASYAAKSLSLTDLFSCIWRTWTRPLITILYTSLLTIAYFSIATMLAGPLLIYDAHPTYIVAIIFGIAALVLYLYLAVPWGLSVVVSVVQENSCGLKALGKATTLVKGKRLHGFLLNMTYVVVCLIVFQGYKMLSNHTEVSVLYLAVVPFVPQFLLLVAYTVMYFHCKKIHGEAVDLHGSVLYTELPTVQTATNMS